MGCLWLQRYYWFKRALPIWTDDRPFPIDIMNMVHDTLDTIRPKMRMCNSFEEATAAVQALEEEYKAKICECMGQDMGLHNASVCKIGQVKICEYTGLRYRATQCQYM